jgi:hypothetical protein
LTRGPEPSVHAGVPAARGNSRAGRPEGRGAVAGLAVRESVTLAGVAERATYERRLSGRTATMPRPVTDR